MHWNSTFPIYAPEYDLSGQKSSTDSRMIWIWMIRYTKERSVDAYTRISGLMLKISGFQPSAPTAMVEMLERSIEIAAATVDAGEATVKEAKSDWNIL